MEGLWKWYKTLDMPYKIASGLLAIIAAYFIVKWLF